MPKFIIERNFAEKLELAAWKEGNERIERINDEEGIKWIFSFLSADKRKTYCLHVPEGLCAGTEAHAAELGFEGGAHRRAYPRRGSTCGGVTETCKGSCPPQARWPGELDT